MSIEQKPLRLSKLTDPDLIQLAGQADQLVQQQVDELARELLLRGLVGKAPVPTTPSFREHHIAFAYSYLPRLCFQHPRRFFDKLLTEGPSALTDLWEHLGKRLSSGEPLSAEALDLLLYEGAVFDGVLVRLPPADTGEEASEVLLTYRAAGTSYAELGCYVRESGLAGRVWEIQFDGSRTEHPSIVHASQDLDPAPFWSHVQALRGVLRKVL